MKIIKKHSDTSAIDAIGGQSLFQVHSRGAVLSVITGRKFSSLYPKNTILLQEYFFLNNRIKCSNSLIICSAFDLCRVVP